jgi:hypothetical protein
MAKIPKKALCFNAPEISLAKGDNEEPKMNMVGYSGGIIKDHWYWGNLAIDVAGVQFKKNKFPILENHWTDQKIGFTSKLKKDENKLTVDPDKTTFLETKYAQEFISNSMKGFPYQASISIIPDKVQRLGEKEEAEVNGFTMKGPGSIIRSCEFKEVSVCVFGYDSNTSAAAMSEEVDVDFVTIETEQGEVEEKMDLKELKEKHPDLVDLISQETEAKFAPEIQELKAQVAEFGNQIKEKDKAIMQFEKDAAIRKENELAMKADGIWSNSLSKSTVPQHLFAKVKKHVSYKDFIKDEVFDETAFTQAVTDEVKDWEESGVTSSVIGGSFGKPKDELPNETELSKQRNQENEKTAEKLLALAGVKIG